VDENDAYDIVGWLADQPWCDGQVGMWGGSYSGFNQWMALKAAPAQLKTVVPAAAVHLGVDCPFFNNIFLSYEICWLSLISGKTGNANLFADQKFWVEKYRELYLSGRPFKELDQVVGNLSPHFQTWLAHPIPDAYWDQMAITPEEYGRIQAPVLTITGHYDGDQPGAMRYYLDHMRYGEPQAKAQHYLVIGPWDHAGTRTPSVSFGGWTFDEASLVDLNELHRQWYDWTLKDGDKPPFLKDRVAYYVMGAEKWKYAADLEAISGEPTRLYLDSNGEANDVFRSGMLREVPPGASPPDRYIYDPLDLRPEELERDPVENYLTDQRYVLNLFDNGVIYHSAPFDADTEISGFVRLVVWIELNVPDTDFTASLYEILPDGRSIRLSEALLRARYRLSDRQEELVTPGEIIRYEFDGFTFFSREVKKGSRLRLMLASPNTIHLQKNYNSGGMVAEESKADARTAHVVVYHDADHPSHLVLPVIQTPAVER
jgi:putative CocE/NonD family hydrolase